MILTALGAGLTVFMGGLTILVTGVILQDNKSPTSVRFTGSNSDMALIYGIFAFVTLFGVVALIAGLWQVIFGRRNMPLIYTILVFGGIFIVLGSLFTD